jgi:glycosyltransferase involved in cell wall biosynthesis
MTQNNKKNKYCYFGIYEPTEMARNQILSQSLEENGMKMIKCVDSSKSFLKFFNLVKKHWKIRKDYDFMIVGYLSNIVVPLARLISRKKVIFNALNAMYEGEILDRERYKKFSFGAMYIWSRDFVAFHSANLILVESESQKKFLSKMFLIRNSKMKVLLTGANDKVFYPSEGIKKNDSFSVVFRGWFLPATGVEYVIEAARILKKDGIKFLIIGRGMLREKIEDMIKKYNLDNIELITEFLPDDVLRKKMLSCNIILGQFANHSRMHRTIQNKTFEAFALRMPYITMDSTSNRELLTDREDCLFVNPADSEDLARKILELKENSKLQEKIAENGYRLYKEKLNPKAIGIKFLDILKHN